MHAKILWIVVLFAAISFAQPSGMVVDMGYIWQPPPQRFRLSPGQVVTLYVHGVTRASDTPVRSRSPLPFEVEGISVTVSDDLGTPHRAPILALRTVSACYEQLDETPCGAVASITIQVPYDLEFRPLGSPRVTIYDRGAAAAILPYSLVDRTFYIITGHDTVSLLDESLYLASRIPLIRHPDGSYVTALHPAKPGETLTFLATGLAYDYTKPALRPKTGEPAAEGITIPIGDPYILGIGLAFQFGKEPAPDPERLRASPTTLASDGLLKAELIPGSVGIYRITIQIPKEIPPGTPNCALDPFPPPAPVTAEFNLRIVLGYVTLRNAFPVFDSAGVCVAIP